MEQAKITVTIKTELSKKHFLGMSRFITQITKVHEFERFELPEPNGFKEIDLHFNYNRKIYDVIADSRVFLQACDEKTFYILFGDGRRFLSSTYLRIRHQTSRCIRMKRTCLTTSMNL